MAIICPGAACACSFGLYARCCPVGGGGGGIVPPPLYMLPQVPCHGACGFSALPGGGPGGGGSPPGGPGNSTLPVVAGALGYRGGGGGIDIIVFIWPMPGGGGDMGGGGGTLNGREGSGPGACRCPYILKEVGGPGGGGMERVPPARVIGRDDSGPRRGEGSSVAVCALGRRAAPGDKGERNGGAFVMVG